MDLQALYQKIVTHVVRSLNADNLVEEVVQFELSNSRSSWKLLKLLDNSISHNGKLLLLHL